MSRRAGRDGRGRAPASSARPTSTPRRRAGKLAGRRFDQIDGGHTGVIHRDAYVKYYEARSARLAGTRFERIDTDRNGVLEASELAAWQAAHRRVSRARPANPAAQ